MVSNISTWAQGIIIAIIIGSIIQMLLPENKNKKYIKVVIGIYILFSVISPVVGKNINLNNYSLYEYMPNTETENHDENYIYSDTIKSTFKTKVTSNIQAQLKAKGYVANSINIDVDDECNILQIKISQICEYNDEPSKVENDKIIVNKIDTNINSVEVDITQKPVERYCGE